MLVVLPKLLLKSVNAMAIYPFIILKDNNQKYNSVLLNHEKIHFQQQKEMLWIIFFIWYVLEFLLKLFIYRNSYEAYLKISLEKEAYFNQKNKYYLTKRKFWSFLKYL